jgi:hypothetical protein
MVSLTDNLWMPNIFYKKSTKWEVGKKVRNKNTLKMWTMKESLVAYYSDVPWAWTPLLLTFGLELEGRTTPLFACVWALIRSQPCVLYVQKMMTNLLGCLLCFFFNCRRQWQAKRFIVILWVFFWVAKNDDKPPNSSSFYEF